MKEISRENYINSIDDYEKLYLILMEEDKVYLRADIEIAETLRIEMMYFEMDTALNFCEANLDSRNCGRKIYFIEYDSDEEAEENILEDFLSIEPEAIYLKCDDNDLSKVWHKYKDVAIYVIIE